jgi:hypothetical protein
MNEHSRKHRKRPKVIFRPFSVRKKEISCVAILNKQKCHFFLLQNLRTEGWNSSCLGGWYQWERGEVGKRYRRVNIEQILCTHVCKCKMIPVETVPGVGVEGRIKENDRGGEFKYDIFGIL